MKVGVVNYGAGNLGNVLRALNTLKVAHSLPDSPDEEKHGELDDCDVLLLPGVGAFRPAMECLASSGWEKALRGWVKEGRPLLGICAGMQLLCRESTEDGRTPGLGFIDASIERLDGLKKIPHMGWNEVEWRDDLTSLFSTRDFYFVHSYAAMESPDCIGSAEADGVSFCAALQKGNVMGFQFHPERSGPDGVNFLGRALEYICGVTSPVRNQEEESPKC